VSSGTAVAVSLTVTAGLAGSVQAAVMGRLGERAGIVPAIALSTVVAVAGAAILVAIVSRGDVGDAFRQPLWLWTGGLLSLFIVLAITVAPPRIGVAATVGFVIAGNLVMAAVIDHFGLFGQDAIAFGWTRLLGLGLLAGGSALLLANA
jgi:bacterial/archaeal transporter family-2 protein